MLELMETRLFLTLHLLVHLLAVLLPRVAEVVVVEVVAHKTLETLVVLVVELVTTITNRAAQEFQDKAMQVVMGHLVSQGLVRPAVAVQELLD
jgi:ABC-type bacteriocin/lantibiotic exporter with double-glycine peptidase domain